MNFAKLRVYPEVDIILGLADHKKKILLKNFLLLIYLNLREENTVFVN
jgi:hypothetical protein